jgi:hypothetical protein
MQLGVEKAKINPRSPQTEFGTQNRYGRVIHPSIGNFIRSKKKYTFGSQKGEINLQGTIMDFETQLQYGRVIYPHRSEI